MIIYLFNGRLYCTLFAGFREDVDNPNDCMILRIIHIHLDPENLMVSTLFAKEETSNVSEICCYELTACRVVLGGRRCHVSVPQNSTLPLFKCIFRVSHSLYITTNIYRTLVDA